MSERRSVTTARLNMEAMLVFLMRSMCDFASVKIVVWLFMRSEAGNHGTCPWILAIARRGAHD